MPLSLRASFGVEITQAQIQRNILVYPQQWEMKDALLGLSTWYCHHELRDAPLECFWGQTDCFLKLCVEPHDSWTKSRSLLVKWATARGYAFRFIHAALQRPCCDSRPVHVRQADVMHRDNLWAISWTQYWEFTKEHSLVSTTVKLVAQDIYQTIWNTKPWFLLFLFFLIL